MTAQSATTDARPWTIVLLLPDAQHHQIAQFCNRQDAEDYLRAIRRYVPDKSFEIVFEPPSDEPI
jgi:hypothetical protein